MAFDALEGAIADGNLSTSQFNFVFIRNGVDFEVGRTTASTIPSIGVLQNDPGASGDGAEVAITGVCKLQYGGTITRGDLIISSSLGQGLTESTAINDYKVAWALQSGTSTGVYFVKLITPFREATAA